jgi:hypothetical protein
VGILCLIVAESAVFIIFVVAYIFYLGKSISGPTPHDVLEIPILGTICLLSSSLTVYLAVAALRRNKVRLCSLWLAATVLLGGIFLAGTAREWYELIYTDGLTIRTNLFGTTFYSLVGLHATHVVVGLIMLVIARNAWTCCRCIGILWTPSGWWFSLWCTFSAGRRQKGIVMQSNSQSGQPRKDTVILPSSTAWPMVLALGLSLIMAGMVTNAAIALLGLLLTMLASVGWFRQVLPVEHHEAIAVQPELMAASSARASVTRILISATHRKMLPVETYKITAGVKGGIAGGAAMSLPAMLFGLIKYHSIWYPINLLAAGGFVSWAGESNAFLAEFHLRGLLAGLAIHGATSLLVGLLYGAMLPMFPKWPILTCGFIAPFLWTGLVYSILGIVSPILDQRIDWLWFTISQCAFGLVAGFVVNLDVKVRTPQFQALPFAVRAGLHADLSERPTKTDGPQ